MPRDCFCPTCDRMCDADDMGSSGSCLVCEMGLDDGMPEPPAGEDES